MKAEQRHRLETNTLADKVGRAVETVRSAPATQSLALWLGIAAVLIVIIAWQFFRSAAHAETSSLWRTLDAATRDTGDVLHTLQSLQEDHPGTTVGTSAGYQLARIKLQDGQMNLGNSLELDRKEAIKKLIDARGQYEKLAKESTDMPLLQQESLMMQAKIDESLIGVADPDKPGETLSTLAKAMGEYEALAKKFPDSAAGVAAQKRLDTLEKDKSQIENFYTQYNELLAISRSSSPPILPSTLEKPKLPPLPPNLSNPEMPPIQIPPATKPGETKPGAPAPAKSPEDKAKATTPAKPVDKKAGQATGKGDKTGAKASDTKAPPAPDKKK
jgi:hypothetical protein